MKHRLAWLILIATPLVFLAAVSTSLRAAAAPGAQLASPTPIPADNSGPIAQAVQEAVAARPGVLAFAINQIRVDRVAMSADGRQALVYLSALDPQSGQPVAREPGFAVASLKPAALAGGEAASGASPSAWQITFQSDSTWQSAFSSLPQDLIPEEYQLSSLAAPTQPQAVTNITLGGYLLPWQGGLAKRLTWSVSHASCYGTDCLYAFDWADGTHFPILAAKGGTVFAAVWNWPNDDHTPGHTNYLILMDTSTTPVSYQVYYHMEQDSVPSALRVKGAQVVQGQFIGHVDNTGASTGSHLHFMVHTNPYGLWGQSVDITFRDVRVNWDPATQGGRPRMCSEASSLPQYGTECQLGDTYVSGNHGSSGPDGGLTAPAEGALLSSSSVHVEGWGKDDLGVSKMQVIARGFGEWVNVGSAQTANPFAEDIDLCAANLNFPDGPVTLALRLWDLEGNQAIGSLGTRTVVKQGCSLSPPPPPACTPEVSQVALYSEPNYAGTCELFGPGSYPDGASLGSLGARQAASIQVGSGASATLFQNPAFQGRAETFIASDPNLADNEIGSLSTSSLRVFAGGGAASPPRLLIPSSLTSDDSIILGWQDTGGDYNFMAEIFNTSDPSHSIWARPFGHYFYKVLDAFSPGNGIPPGNYSLRVCVSPVQEDPNAYLTCPSGWASTSQPFTVTQAAPAAALAGSPFASTFDTGAQSWSASAGWSLGPGYENTQGYVFNQNGTCQDGLRCTGTLTSPAISIPASGDSYVHFKYRYSRPQVGPNADVRRVQVSASADGGTSYSGFSDLYTFAGSLQDTPDTWLSSPDGIVISCSKYCGKLVRLRFFFDSIDAQANSGVGWAVDDVSVDQTGSRTTWDQPAVALSLGAAQNGALSLAGNIDWYSFDASQGGVYQVDLTAAAEPTRLDLLDSGKTSVLATGHAADTSPQRLSFRAPASGLYYIRVYSDPYPGGGPGFTYTIRVQQLSDTTPPAAAIAGLATGGYLNAQTGTLKISGNDGAGGSGLSRVDYYYHLSNWLTGRWWKIGTGWNPADGWSVSLDPSAIPETGGVAILARAVDWAQNASDAAVWNLTVDRTPPSTALSALPATSPNTAVQLIWSASDNLSGIDHFDLEITRNQDPPRVEPLPAGARSTWIVGAYGDRFSFRLRGVDRAGNAEAYPFGAEASVSMVDPGDGNDPYEGADSPQAATELAPDGPAIQRTFYNQGGQADQDWVSFQAKAGQRYFIWATPLPGSPAAAQIAVYLGADAASAGTPSATGSAPGLGMPELLAWTAPQDGRVLVKLSSIDPAVEGSGVAYLTRVGTHLSFYLPSISH